MSLDVQAIKRWVGLGGKDRFFGIEITRIGERHVDEEKFQEELTALCDKYTNVPMFMMQNVLLKWFENGEKTFIYLPEDPGLYAVIYGCTFDGSVEMRGGKRV